MKRLLRVLIVDDEKPARARLEALLLRQPGVEVAATCEGGEEALRTLEAAVKSGAAIDIVFLDVQMPEMDGFEMLDALYSMPLDSMPVVVFATAHDAYALRAFDAHAVDYLLKPYSDERFEAALARASRMVGISGSGSLIDRMHALLADLAGAAANPDPVDAYPDRIAIKERGRVRLISVGDIRWIAAAGVYVTIHTGDEAYLHREVLGGLESRLDPRRFVRVHRSHIVNFDFVRELVQDAHGDYTVRLTDDTTLKVSRMYRPRLEQRIQQRL